MWKSRPRWWRMTKEQGSLAQPLGPCCPRPQMCEMGPGPAPRSHEHWRAVCRQDRRKLCIADRRTCEKRLRSQRSLLAR
eukprot:scaffold273721_cov36-Tisochrysis_lutea.AAC.3